MQNLMFASNLPITYSTWGMTLLIIITLPLLNTTIILPPPISVNQACTEVEDSETLPTTLNIAIIIIFMGEEDMISLKNKGMESILVDNSTEIDFVNRLTV